MKTTPLALQLIKDCKKKKNKKLDLGYCGLRAVPKEIFELTWLEELILRDSYWDDQQEQWIHSPNLGEINKLSSLPEGWTKLKNLKKLFIVHFVIKIIQFNINDC